VFYVVDEGGATASNNLTIARSGSDVIVGATSVTVNVAYTSLTLYSDGTSAWFII